MYYQPGLYYFRITAQGFGEAKKSGNPQFILQGEPTSQVTYDDDGNMEQSQCERSYTREIRLTITPNTVDRVIANLVKIGWPGRKFSDLMPDTANSFSFVDVEFIAECTHEPSITGDGKIYEKWDFPYVQKAAEPIKSVNSVAKKLDNLFGDKLKKLAPNAAKAPPKAPTQKQTVPPDDAPDFGPPPEGDEIPF
jgi:hypothetical protein